MCCFVEAVKTSRAKLAPKRVYGYPQQVLEELRDRKERMERAMKGPKYPRPDMSDIRMFPFVMTEKDAQGNDVMRFVKEGK